MDYRAAWSNAEIAIIVGAITVIISTLLPWSSLTTINSYATPIMTTTGHTGVEGPGILVLIGGIAVLVFGLLKRGSWKSTLSLGIYLMGMLALAYIIISPTYEAINSFNVHSGSGSFSMFAGFGQGFYLCIFGLLVIVIASISQMRNNKGNGK